MARLCSILLLALVIASSASAITMDWTPIGDPGNAPDTEVMACCGSSTGTSGYGAVPYSYFIGKYEVINAQYTEFLNAVARISDPNGLYNGFMSSGYGGITRSGSSGNYTYTAISGRENMPVTSVSFYDSLRFANWMNNGQPNTGSQTSGTTEGGAYTFSGTTIVGPRNANATIFLSRENEWYKAAYYDPSTASYYDFAAGTDAQMICAAPTAAPNSGNCAGANNTGPYPQFGDMTPVGSYTGSPSPYGTFDQGGNVFEWLENTGTPRSLERAGYFTSAASEQGAATRYADSDNPVAEPASIGFRLVMIPEPGTGVLVFAGLLGLTGWRRARA